MTSNPPPAWTITSQAPQAQAALGRVQDGYMIHFITAGGHPGELWVRMADYTPDRLRPLLDQAAANIDAIGAMTGDPAS